MTRFFGYLRWAAFVVWTIASVILILPYVAPIGWRVVFVATTAPEYIQRWLEADFWRASWGMSSDLIYGSLEGRYDGHDVESLVRLAVIVAMYSAAFRIRIGHLGLACAIAVCYFIAVLQSWIIPGFSPIGCQAMILGATSLSCLLRPRSAEGPATRRRP